MFLKPEKKLSEDNAEKNHITLTNTHIANKSFLSMKSEIAKYTHI